MAYNLMFARRAVDDNSSELWGYRLDGNNKYVTRTIRTELSENSRIGYLKCCEYAVKQIKSLMEFKELPWDSVVLHINTALYWKYIKFFIDSNTGTRPPKEYFDAAYQVFQALESLPSGYVLQFSPWAKVNPLVTEHAWQRAQKQSTERATDVFEQMTEED